MELRGIKTINNEINLFRLNDRHGKLGWGQNNPEWLDNKMAIPVKIPMMGHVDSLNASISASIVIYEALRQRSALPR